MARVIKIIVSYAETRSFGNHHNVRPSVTYEAEITPDSNVVAETSDMIETAKVHVQMLVDDALEANGHSPAYDTDDLYRVRFSNRRKMVVITRSTEATRADFFPHGAALRLSAAEESASRYARITGFKLIDGIFDSGDFDELEILGLPQEMPHDEIPF